MTEIPAQEKHTSTGLIVDYTALAAVAALYIYVIGDLARALGSLTGVGLTGWLLYEFFGRKLAQPPSRRAAIGVAVASLVALPGISEKNATGETARFEAGKAIGEIHMACKMDQYLSDKYCPKGVLAAQALNDCKFGVVAMVKEKYRSDISKTLSGDEFRQVFSETVVKIDRNIMAQGVDRPAACSAYAQLLNDTFRKAKMTAAEFLY